MKPILVLAAVVASMLAPSALSEPAARLSDMPLPKRVAVQPCVPGEIAFTNLRKTAVVHGGIVALMKSEVAQDFADGWRLQALVSPEEVTLVFVWIRDAVTIAEVDGANCLSSVTVVSFATFTRLVEGLPDRVPSVAI